MKEAILAFLIALIIGAGINQFQASTPPAALQEPTVNNPADAESDGAADMRNVQPTSDKTFEQDVLKSEIPVLVDFYSDNCAPCKAMAPVVARLANDCAGRAKLVRLDVDANPEMTKKYRIASIPSFIVFNNGHKGDWITGIVPEERLLKALDKLQPFEQAQTGVLN